MLYVICKIIKVESGEQKIYHDGTPFGTTLRIAASLFNGRTNATNTCNDLQMTDDPAWFIETL